MISVIIPTFNREQTILRSLQSVLEQTYTDLEVLIIDDGSTDDTGAVVSKIQDNRIQYIPLKENAGVANARNVGGRLAKGEWIAFQDSDDCWHRDKLEKQMNYAKRNPQHEMIYSLYDAHSSDGRIFPSLQKPFPAIMEGNMLSTLLVKNVIGAPTILIKRETFLESGGFDTSYKSLEDWEYVIRFSKEHSIGFLPEVLMEVYMLQGGVSSHVGNYFESRCRILRTYKQELLQEGLFESVAMDILTRAQKAGILEQIEKMLQIYLQ